MHGDPYWLTARFTGTCAGRTCDHPIRKGDRIFYYPNGRKAYVGPCAEAAAADFDSAAFDEAVNESMHVR